MENVWYYTYDIHVPTNRMNELDLLIKKYTLQNAILHHGKADIKAVLGKIIAERPQTRSEISLVIPMIKTIIDHVNMLPIEEQKIELEKLNFRYLIEKEKKSREIVLPELPNVKGEVVMRSAPFPSGPLHIGNARMVILNDEYVKRYGGKHYLVFDDTIGSKTKIPIKEGYELIIDGLNWLGVTYHEVIFKSDRLEIFYEWCRKLLEKGYGYVCECKEVTLRKYRKLGIECKHRSQDVENNIQKWDMMLTGEYEEGDAVVRLKTEMKHENPAFRDRVLFRISYREHPRVGKRYRVWPLLEFSWSVDDYLLGITHVLRGKDLVMEDIMESYIWDLLGIKGPEFIHYGLLSLKDMKLSKSKLRIGIESGDITGWDDPRTWSLQSLRERGILPEVLRKFILEFGMSLTDIEVPAESLYSENRKVIDSIADRLFFVNDPVEINLSLPKQIEYVEIPKHPSIPEKGKRVVRVGSRVYIPKQDFELYAGKEVRLKDFCTILLDKKSKFISFEKKDVCQKIQWVHDGVLTKVIMDDGSCVEGLCEKYPLKKGQIVQFERFGFVKIRSVGDEIVALFTHK